MVTGGTPPSAADCNHALHQPTAEVSYNDKQMLRLTMPVQYYNTLEDFREPVAEAGSGLRRIAAVAKPADAMAAGSSAAAIEGG